MAANSSAGLIIIIKKLEKGPFTDKEIELLHEKESYKFAVGDYAIDNFDGKQFIDGERASVGEFKNELKRLDKEIVIRSLVYLIYYKQLQIKISFSTQGLKDKEKYIDLMFELAKPSFKRMANSFVIDSKWE